MADATPNLTLPFILPSQSQKHVTHNEALLTLDALIHLTVTAKRSEPPASPQDGTAYLVGPQPSGSWAGKQYQVAAWQDGSWTFLQPREGWRAWFVDELALKVFSDGEWRSIVPGAPVFESVGIASTADGTNRLALSSPASLFNHAGAGHQLKINKQDEAENATLLFQSAWVGHAELGLAGDNTLSLKVSDGTSWKTGMSIDADGRVLRPNQPMARAYRAGTSFSPAAGQQSGFTHFAVDQGDVGMGAALAGGGNGILVPATGIYLLCLNVAVASSGGHSTALLVNGGAPLLTLPGGSGLQSASTIAALSAGDLLTLGHEGSANLQLGPGKTELTVALL